MTEPSAAGNDEADPKPRERAGRFLRDAVHKTGYRPPSGGSGIRTHGANHPTVFKTVAFVRSAIPPSWGFATKR